jgi:hypothetical protein
VAARPGAQRARRPDPKKRGRKPTPIDPWDRKIAELERQFAHMTGRAERAEALVEPKKLRLTG